MAIEVRIPTILRTYTGGAKAVEGPAARWPSCSPTWTASTTGLRERLVDDDGLRRFVNVYVNDEDVRFLGGLDDRGQGRRHRDRPAGGRRRRGLTPRRRRARLRRHALRLPGRLARRHPAGRAAAAVAVAGRAAVGQARGPQPDRSVKDRAALLHGRAGREGRPAAAGRHDPGADLGQHRHLAGHGGQAARLPADLRDAGEHLGRAPAAAGDVRRADHLLAGRGRLQRGGRGWPSELAGRAPRLGDALPVRQRGQRAGPLRDHRARSCWPTCRRSPTSSPGWAPPAR